MLWILILFMAVLLVCQMLGTKEGMTSSPENTDDATNKADATNKDALPDSYKPYDNNISILAHQNAGNIQVLKGQVDDLNSLKNDVATMKQSMSSMQTQIDGLVQQQADYAQSLAGSTPATITGTDEDE